MLHRGTQLHDNAGNLPGAVRSLNNKIVQKRREGLSVGNRSDHQPPQPGTGVHQRLRVDRLQLVDPGAESQLDPLENAGMVPRDFWKGRHEQLERRVTPISTGLQHLQLSAMGGCAAVTRGPLGTKVPKPDMAIALSAIKPLHANQSESASASVQALRHNDGRDGSGGELRSIPLTTRQRFHLMSDDDTHSR
jgi:hypothetical protein